MIRWKVVRRDGRYSACIDDLRYQLQYPKGAVVTALPHTIGIATFKRNCDAVEFMQSLDRVQWGRQANFRILRVQTIGRGMRPRSLSYRIDAHSLGIFYHGSEGGESPRLDTYWGVPPPQGTMCYKQVKVLD